MKFFIESLGCARNLVDSEIMIGRLKRAGWSLTDRPEEAELIVVNTCSFIKAAANESIDAILSLARFKKKGACKRLVVAGCLPERYQEDIAVSLPEVDAFLGTGALDRIIDVLERGSALNDPFPDPDLSGVKEDAVRQFEKQPFAYLKIAEGCDRHCTYCVIPKLRGKQKSRDPHLIVEEARSIIHAGIKEIVLVSQDTTHYGSDLNSPFHFSELLSRISLLSPDIWVRFLYGHPDSIDQRIIDTVASHPNICPYFDLPIQHASTKILKSMGRNHTKEDLLKLFETIRSTVSPVSLRTTVITGFPGETDEDFQELMDFIEMVRFDHLGVFIYSDSDDLPAHHLPSHVPAKIARERRKRLMERQRDISSENIVSFVGQSHSVLVEEIQSQDLLIGRTVFQAPEVDGIVYIKKSEGRIVDEATMINVTITDSYEYDLVGVLNDNS